MVWWFIAVLETIYPLICRHQWILERRRDGSQGLRCMRCLKRKEHTLARLIEWNPDYRPTEQPVSNISPDSDCAHNWHSWSKEAAAEWRP